MRVFLICVLAIAALLVAPLSGASAQADEQPAAPASVLEQSAADIAAVMRGEKAAEEVFAPGFLAAVPAAQFNQVVTQMTTQFGPFVGVEKVVADHDYAGTIFLRFEKAIGSGALVVEPQSPHRVAGLLLQTFEPIGDSAEKIAADLAALPGTVSVLFAPLDGASAPGLARAEDAQLAIGSAFKLYVLATLALEIEGGKRRWDDVVRLDTRSFPSGMMQQWPQGTPVTLQTLASMMISISDNTATDQLIRLLGRKAIERTIIASGHAAPERMQPLLTTLDLFKLKGDLAIGDAWLAQDPAGRRARLAAFEREHRWQSDNVTPPTFTAPTAIDTLEWFASARDLKGVLAMLAAMEDDTARKILAINPSLPAGLQQNWSYAGYKGGSEPGVLNLSWLLRDRGGGWHVLVMTWNHPQAAVQTATLELLAQRVLALGN